MISDTLFHALCCRIGQKKQQQVQAVYLKEIHEIDIIKHSHVVVHQIWTSMDIDRLDEKWGSMEHK